MQDHRVLKAIQEATGVPAKISVVVHEDGTMSFYSDIDIPNDLAAEVLHLYADKLDPPTCSHKEARIFSLATCANCGNENGPF